MIRHHRISMETFERIATGQGDAELAHFLAKTQLSRNLLMMAHIAEREPELWDAVETLSAAQKYDAAQTGAVIGYPWVGVWAAKCVASGVNPAAGDYLSQVSAAAAIRAGLGSRPTTAPARFLPTLGVPGECDDAHAPSLAVPLRVIAAEHRGHRIAVIFDDLDPHRTCLDHPVAARVTDDQWREWHVEFESAWRLLAEFAPERCEELSTGLFSIVPLAETHGTGISVTHSDAFGGLGCTRAYDPAQFACVLIHEFQHSKLNALMNLIPLNDPANPARFAVPWKLDERPLAGVLHGLFAFTAVASFWGALRADPASEAVAIVQFERVREQVVEVMRWIGGAPGLTLAGKRFTSMLGHSVAALSR